VRSLSDTISRLTAFHGLPGKRTNLRSADHLRDLPEFGSNPGALGAKVYIPEGLPPAAPLVVVLHGCTQTAADYDHGSGWSRLAARYGFALLFPEQQRSNNPNLCFNWFVPGNIRRDAGEALSIRQMVETLVTRLGIDRKRIFVTGLSAGGAMTSVMLATYPDVFAGGAIIAGLPYGCATTIPKAFDRMRGHGFPTQRNLQSQIRAASKHDGPWPTISIWHGTADRTVVPSNATEIVGQWRAVHQLEAIPTRTDLVDGYPRRVWCDVNGRELIEEYSITGMGHGTPIAVTGPHSCGTAGPFMLDVGISSTFHIARSWGLTMTAEERSEKDVPHQTSSSGAAPIEGVRQAEARPEALSSESPTSGELSPSVQPATGIRKAIEDALRAAGLMR
jgi:poly(hydroxyalkanoate) depolymerase family esterase